MELVLNQRAGLQVIKLFYPGTGRNAYIFISKAIRTTREMIIKRISGQQKQPGSFILQA